MEAIDRFINEVPEPRGQRSHHFFLKTIRYALEDGSIPSERQLGIVRDIFREHKRPASDVHLFES